MIIFPRKNKHYRAFEGTIPELEDLVIKIQKEKLSWNRYPGYETTESVTNRNRLEQEEAYLREKLNYYRGLYGGTLGTCESTRIYTNEDVINFPDYDVYMEKASSVPLSLPESNRLDPGVLLPDALTKRQLFTDPQYADKREEMGLPRDGISMDPVLLQRRIDAELSPKESDLDKGAFERTSPKDSGYVIPEPTGIKLQGTSQTNLLIIGAVVISAVIFLPKILKK